MAQQTVGVGTTANDGTGDAPRTAGQKINSNFDELYAAIASLTSSVAGKANTSHTHLVANLSDATTHAKQLLQSYANTDFATSAHTHILSDVDELVDALASKYDSSHVGTTANKLVQLTADAKLPAVDGSLLTNVSGGGYTAKTANYTILTTDYTINCTTNTFALTLPTAVGATGQVYNLKNSGSGVITINTTSSQTIDGSASGSLTLNQYDSYTLQSDGANWIIL